MLQLQHFRWEFEIALLCGRSIPICRTRRKGEVMRYSGRALLMALVVAGALPILAFTQSAEWYQSAAETAVTAGTTVQWHEIAPGRAQSFVLGDAVGVAYFVSEPGGLRLVATVGDNGGNPVRFVTTLAPDQVATISVPRRAGEESIEVSFLRKGEALAVKTASHTSN
jgi:hypothetical protein